MLVKLQMIIKQCSCFCTLFFRFNSTHFHLIHTFTILEQHFMFHSLTLWLIKSMYVCISLQLFLPHHHIVHIQSLVYQKSFHFPIHFVFLFDLNWKRNLSNALPFFISPVCMEMWNNFLFYRAPVLVSNEHSYALSFGKDSV